MPSTTEITRRAEQALALLDAQTARPEAGTDWLREATYIASLYIPPDTGRPSDTLVDVQRVAKVLSLVARGNYIETACIAAGINKVTLYGWRKQADAGNVAAIAFVNALEKAQAEAETEAVDHIRSTRRRPELWAASMTHLERRHPDRWGKRQDDASVPKVVVQIGARDSDVSVSVGSIIEPRTSVVDVTPSDAMTCLESAQVTEGSLSDAESGRIKVTAQSEPTSERTRTRAATGQRRGNRVGLRAGSRGRSQPDGADRVKDA